MTQTCTYAQSKQLHLFNIITFAEDKLQSNFNRILYRLNKHEKMMESNQKYAESLEQKINTIVSRLEQRFDFDEQRSNQFMHSKHIQLNLLNNNLRGLVEKVEGQEKSLNQFIKMQEGLRLFIDQECEARNQIIQSVKQKMRNVEHEVSQIETTLHRKQDIKQVMSLKNELSELSHQVLKVQDEQKFVQFKLDKFEINNQKNEKIQMNKEIMLIKDLQQKIKNQLKSSAKSQNQRNTLQSIENLQSEREEQAVSILHKYNFMESSLSVERPNTRADQPTRLEYQAGGSFSFNQTEQLTPIMLNKINEALARYDRKFEQIQKQIKRIFELQSYQKKKKVGTTDLQEKINAVKPELIKIWSKFDALDDKQAFTQKRMDQKSKQISHLMEVLKENQSFKFDEKLKLLQAQIFTHLKEIRNKLDNKINMSDHEKFSKITLQKMQNMSDQIILKSDKLEVKKALLFLESKIKQIILVISQQEQNQKDALLTKKQIKCISCDKEIQKFLGTTSGAKGNWDCFPFKEHSTDALGKFGMTSYGSLARKLKRLDNKDSVFTSIKRSKQSTHSEPKADLN